VLAGLVAACLPAPAVLLAQMATAERIQGPRWWPTTPLTSRQDYVGPEACASCHGARAATQETSNMARTLWRAGQAGVLREHDPLAFKSGNYSYSIATSGPQSLYTVTDGTNSLTAPLAWAFGVGKVGQSYLFERDGKLHESRVSFYGSVPGLDFTPNRALTAPRDLEEAMSRPVGDAEARRCFGCHATAPTTTSGFKLDTLIPGVTCEACHGPGRTHIAAVEREASVQEVRRAIVNPRTLDPVDSVDFCGACHATFWDVKLADERGLAALRSQPYRLQSSRCWGEGDARITCVACHDPHKPLERAAPAYNARCLACHAATGSTPTPARPVRACKVASADCVTCHMPKYDVPEMHFKFTDHLIRVVRPNQRGPAASVR
jgi:Cytochrome c554 and c-prime